MNASEKSSEPLGGIRVLDFTHVLSGLFGSTLLGDLGADVIKIESPNGDITRKSGPPFQEGESAYFFWVNRNKRGIILDLKKPEAKRIVYRMAKQCDVLMENFRQAWGHGIRRQFLYSYSRARTAVLPWRGTGTVFARPSESRECIDDPNYGEIAYRVSHYNETVAMVENITTRKTTAEWLELCEIHQVAGGKLNSVEEAFEDPGVVATEMVKTMQHRIISLGTMKNSVLRSPVRVALPG